MKFPYIRAGGISPFTDEDETDRGESGALLTWTWRNTLSVLVSLLQNDSSELWSRSDTLWVRLYKKWNSYDEVKIFHTSQKVQKNLHSFRRIFQGVSIRQVRQWWVRNRQWRISEPWREPYWRAETARRRQRTIYTVMSFRSRGDGTTIIIIASLWTGSKNWMDVNTESKRINF